MPNRTPRPPDPGGQDMPATDRPLGDNQKRALKNLKYYGSGGLSADWFLGNGSNTLRILESLVRRGLAQRERPPGAPHDVYTLTDAGKAYDAT